MTMTAASSPARAHDGRVPEGDDPAARPARRRFTAQYKMAILEEYDTLVDPGAKGALLRRKGLYSSHIVERNLALGQSLRVQAQDFGDLPHR